MTVNLAPENFELTHGALKHFNCSKCHKDKPCVVKVASDLICINCRFNDIGKAALYEGLYNGLD